MAEQESTVIQVHSSLIGITTKSTTPENKEDGNGQGNA